MSKSVNQQNNFKRLALPNLLWRLWQHIGMRRKRQFFLLLGLMLFSAFAELVSLGAVMPFLGVIISPERVLGFPFVSEAANVMGITTPADLVLPLSAAFAFAALIAGCIRMLLLWSSNRLAYATGADLSMDV